MICSGGMAGGSLVMGVSAALCGAGLGAAMGGAPEVGPVEGGGVSGPVDWATSETAKNTDANETELRTCLTTLRRLNKTRISHQ